MQAEQITPPPDDDVVPMLVEVAPELLLGPFEVPLVEVPLELVLDVVAVAVLPALVVEVAVGPVDAVVPLELPVEPTGPLELALVETLAVVLDDIPVAAPLEALPRVAWPPVDPSDELVLD